MSRIPRALLGFLMLCALAAPAIPQGIKLIRHGGLLHGPDPAQLAEITPPERFQGNQAVVADFGPVAELCDAGAQDLACTKRYRNGAVLLVLPNPCPLADREVYAAIACHELGHLNGWPATHGD